MFVMILLCLDFAVFPPEFVTMVTDLISSFWLAVRYELLGV